MKSIIFVAALVIAAPCFAGNISLPEVTITKTSTTLTTATGSVQGARYSNDNTQSLSCNLTASKPRSIIGGSTVTGTCVAIDKTGNQASCTTADAVLLQAIATVNSSSVVTFVVNASAASNDNCKSIEVENASSAIN